MKVSLSVEDAHDLAIALNAAILYEVERGVPLTDPVQVRRERLFRLFLNLEENLRAASRD